MAADRSPSYADLVRQIPANLALMALGSALCAVALNGILVPQRFVSPGVTGIALLIHYLEPRWSVATLYLLLNIPLFVVGWFQVGRRFLLYSLAGAALFTLAVATIHVSIQVEDKILAALLAGIITGLGSGVILRSQGSAGGVDILAIMLFRRFSIRLGSTSLAFNSVVMALVLVLADLETVLYTLIFIFVSAKMVNLVVTGLSQRKAVTIISRKWEDIERAVLSELNRGVTVFQGRGGYSGTEEKILYTVITFQELARLKRTVKALDPEAFVVVTETLEVIGQRIGNEPHW